MYGGPVAGLMSAPRSLYRYLREQLVNDRGDAVWDVSFSMKFCSFRRHPPQTEHFWKGDI